MASTNNTLQLLIDLGVSDNSKNNINEYIRQLKGLEKVKVELDVQGSGSMNKDFTNTSKIIEDLQEQVKQLKGELKGLGSGTSISAEGIENFKKEIGRSIKSISDLEKRVKDFNGTISLTYGNVKMPNGIEEKVLKSVNAKMTSADGSIKSLNFKPTLDNNGFITGLKEITETVNKVDFKDFNKKAEKTEQLLKELGRQGYITANDFSDFEKRLENLKVNKSVTDLERLNTELKETNKELSHKTKMDNSLANVKKQAEELTQTLNKLSNVKSLDTSQISKYAKELNSLSEIKKIGTDSELKKVNSDFKSVENGIKSLVKEANRLSKVDNEIEKLQNTIEKFKKQGSLSQKQANDFLLDTKKIENTSEAVKKLENQINNTANSTTATNKIKNAMDGISPSVDRLNDKLDLMVKKLGSNIDSSKLEKLRSEILKISNTELKTVDEIAKLNQKLSQAEKGITQLGVASNNTNRFEDQLRKTNKLLDELEQSGYSTSETIDKFKRELNNIPTGDLNKVKKLLNDVEGELSSIGKERKVLTLLDEMREKAHALETRMNRTKNLFRGTFDPEQARLTANAINHLREQIDKISTNPIKATQRELDELRNTARLTSNQVGDFHSDSTTATRNSMGMIESFRVAMTKFPVWMAASTLFYSTIRGVQDLTEKVIELDTAMTSLIRVTDGEQFEFDQVIDRANEKVTELSSNMTDYLKLVTDFARTGKTIDESFDLASTSSMLMNISELNAEQAINSLTAAMIAFNIEAEDSARIADKINEIDNNFAVTTLDLSQAMNKASATAKTFGVELDTLLGYATGIGAATRESGNIVG